MPGRSATNLVTILVAAGLLLTGCVPSPPDPDPAPTRTAEPRASAGPTETAKPAEPVVAVDGIVTEIVVRPEHLDLVNGSGVVVEELSYDADAAVFVDVMSGALGGPPSIAEFPGGHEWFATTRYSWPGVLIIDDHEPEGVVSDMNVAIEFTHPIVGEGISVATVQGFRPGDDAEAFAAELGETWHGTGYDEFPAETGPDIGERMYFEWDDTFYEYANANAVSVNLWNRGDDPSVTSVVMAPWNFGIGHV